jgi:hypothetical protein
LFERTATSWEQSSYIKASNTGAFDQFGESLALSNGVAVIGAPQEDSNSVGVNGDGNNDLAPQSGAAYVIDLEASVGIYCSPGTPNATTLPASISHSGSLALADNNFTLHAVDLPQNQTGYFLNSRGIDYVARPGGSSGDLCLGGSEPIGRHNRAWEVRNSGSGGSVSLTLDLNDLPYLQAATVGETWNFQCWFRNPGGTGGSNFSDAISVRFE